MTCQERKNKINTSSVNTHLPEGVEIENIVPDPESFGLVVGEMYSTSQGGTRKKEEKMKGGEQ